MNKKLIFSIVIGMCGAVSSSAVRAVECPQQAITLNGLTVDEKNFYRNVCKMQINFEKYTLEPLITAPQVVSAKFGIRAEGINSVAS